MRTLLAVGAEFGCFPRKPALLIFSKPCAVGKPRLICNAGPLPGREFTGSFLHSYEMDYCPNSWNRYRSGRLYLANGLALLVTDPGSRQAKCGEASGAQQYGRDDSIIASYRVVSATRKPNRFKASGSGCFSEAFLLPGNSSSHC